MIFPLLLTTVLTLPQTDNAPAPPGLASVSGGRTYVGVSVKEIEKVVEEMSEARTVVRSLDGCTPQYQTQVAPFYLAFTETTQEQYAAFVRATGYRPPQTWGADAIEEARLAFFEDLRARAEAGESVTGIKFDPEEWWDDNWEGQDWAIPQGDELRPVVNVSYYDCVAYCTWAGLRLPTEPEFEHAIRKKSKDPYPWGDEWEDGMAATSELRRASNTFPAGSFPKGASADGIHDLVGNVWEWTSSPYVAHEGFKRNSYKIPGQRKKESVPTPKWDGNQVCVKSGSYHTSSLAGSAFVRRGTEKTQSTDGLGFRTAGSLRPVRDYAQLLWESSLRNAEARPNRVTFDPALVMGQDMWTFEAGAEGAPEGYQVITGYEHFAIIPRAELEEVGDVPFRKASLTEPQALGILTMTSASIEPALAPGAYFIAFRAKGETRVEESEEDKGERDAGKDDDGGDDEEEKKTRRGKKEDPWAEVLDIEQDHLILFSATSGEMVAAIPVDARPFGKPDGEAGFHSIDKTAMLEDPAKPGKKIAVEEKWLKVNAEVTTRRSRWVLPFTLELKMEPEFWEKNWRKQ